jgi:hypothetical protein
MPPHGRTNQATMPCHKEGSIPAQGSINR